MARTGFTPIKGESEDSRTKTNISCLRTLHGMHILETDLHRVVLMLRAYIVSQLFLRNEKKPNIREFIAKWTRIPSQLPDVHRLSVTYWFVSAGCDNHL